MSTCAERACKEEVGGAIAIHLPRARKCSGCGAEFCPTHARGASWFAHLGGAASDAGARLQAAPKGYLCRDCARSAGVRDRSVLRAVMRRTCSHPTCLDDLSGYFTTRRSCAECGAWYCKEHSVDRTEWVTSSWEAIAWTYPTAGGLCERCWQGRQETLIPESVRKQWQETHLVMAHNRVVTMEALLSGTGDADRIEPGFDLAAAAPSLLRALIHLVNDPRLPSKFTPELFQAISYISSPIDLLPDRRFGWRGLWDDAAIGALRLASLAEHESARVEAALQNQGLDASRLGSLLKVFEQLVPPALRTNAVRVLGIEGWRLPVELPVENASTADVEPDRGVDRSSDPLLARTGQLEWTKPWSARTERVVVFVHGFTQEDGDYGEWRLPLVESTRPSGEFATTCFRWGAGSLPQLPRPLQVALKFSPGAALGWIAKLAKNPAKWVRLAPGVLLSPQAAAVAAVLALGAAAGGVAARQYWKTRVENADLNALVLAGILMSDAMPRAPITLVGHSLGGRIVLKVAELIGGAGPLQRSGEPPRLDEVIALAPAIARDELDFDAIRAGVRRRPEIFYSSDDAVLGKLFGVGEWSSKDALGWAGPDPADDRVHGIDASDLRRNNYGHGYATCLRQALRRSPAWNLAE